MYIVATRGSTLVLGDERPERRRRAARHAPSEELRCRPGLRSSRSRFSSSSLIVIVKAIRVVPQQHALGRRAARPLPRGARSPGSISSFRSSTASPTSTTCARSRSTCRRQICITKDNTQLQVDGILYFQVTDPKLASYGSTQLRARDHAARADDAAQRDRPDGARPHVRGARPDQRGRSSRRSTQAARNWGVKVLRYEIKDLTPPEEILHAMQAQITAEREKRAVIATSEGRQQEQINLAHGAREAAIAQVRRREAGGDQQRAGPGGGDPRHRRGERQGDPPGRPKRSQRPAASAR